MNSTHSFTSIWVGRHRRIRQLIESLLLTKTALAVTLTVVLWQLIAGAAGAQGIENAQPAVSSVKTGRVEGPDVEDPVKNCMAAQSMMPVEKKKNGPMKLIAKSVASELGTDSSDMMKDAVFVFSAKDVDPYDKSPPTNKPYTLLEITYIDGSQASLIKYPDNSGKIEGGFADGTIVAPAGKDNFIVAYPNGVRGKMVKVSSSEYKIYRPDNSITTIKKTMSGAFDISNDKTGYMGSAQPDRLGMQFEFNTKNF